MKLLLSPHNDDEALFASYTILRHRPLVLTCLDGRRKSDFPAPAERVAESMAAMEALGGVEYDHLWVPLAYEDWSKAIERRIRLRGLDPEHVWAPFPEPNGHPHHNGVGELATRLWPGRVSFFATYTVDGDGVHKSAEGGRVPTEPGWDDLKRAALRCYPSQSRRGGTRMHFRAPLDEYEVPTLRLNLGGEINRLPGYVNMDVSYGWKFEDGLGMWGDGSVEAISESHSLMYVRPEHWPLAFEEMARVLKRGGTLRVTQDAIGAPGSGRPVIRPGAHVATTERLVLDHCAAAGLDAWPVAPDETRFVDRTLIQQNYGQPPNVFHVEAVKP